MANSAGSACAPLVYLIPIDGSSFATGTSIQKSKSLNDVAPLLCNKANGTTFILKSNSLGNILTPNSLSAAEFMVPSVATSTSRTTSDPTILTTKSPTSNVSKRSYPRRRASSGSPKVATVASAIVSSNSRKVLAAVNANASINTFKEIDEDLLLPLVKRDRKSKKPNSPNIESASVGAIESDEKCAENHKFQIDTKIETGLASIISLESCSGVSNAEVGGAQEKDDIDEFSFDLDFPLPNASKSHKRTQRRASEIVPVATLVFFDLETTGLPHEIGKPNVQITEVSMIAMSRKEFEQSTSSELKDIRIIQKLCLCIRPRAMISSVAARITGLDNVLLSDQNQFDEFTASSITSFLSHLPKPVCLLAHNGTSFDFPLLKAELSRLSFHLPSDILSVDSLKGFREFGVPVFPPEKKICKSVKYTSKGQVSYGLENLHLYMFNRKPAGSHSSEGDCIALAKVCHRMKDVMLPWIDENCIPFNDFSTMW